jgi:crossover junction endodeoxyribonuclease RusA
VTTIEFAVPTARILNANQRLHWSKRAAMTRLLRTEASLHAHDIAPMSRAHLTVHVGWPDKRRRDVSNIAPTLKACIDGFVSDAGLLPDDSDAYLVGPDLRPFVAGRKGYVVLTFCFEEITE